MREYRESEYSGRRVKCNGTGRRWVKEYEGKTGTLLGECAWSRMQIICFDDGEHVGLYYDEYALDK